MKTGMCPCTYLTVDDHKPECKYSVRDTVVAQEMCYKPYAGETGNRVICSVTASRLQPSTLSLKIQETAE